MVGKNSEVIFWYKFPVSLEILNFFYFDILRDGCCVRQILACFYNFVENFLVQEISF